MAKSSLAIEPAVR